MNNKLFNRLNLSVSIVSLMMSGLAVWFAYDSVKTSTDYTEKEIRRGVYDEIINSFAEDYRSITSCDFLNVSKEHYGSFMRSKFIENKEIHDLLEKKYAEYNEIKESTKSICENQINCLSLREELYETLEKNKSESDEQITDLNENSRPEYSGLLISETGSPLIPVLSTDPNNKRPQTGSYTGTATITATMTMKELRECDKHTQALEDTAIKLQKSFQEVSCLMAKDLGITSADCEIKQTN